MVNMILTMLTGVFVVVFYAVEIFQSSKVDMDSYLSAIIIAAIRVIGNCVVDNVMKNLPYHIYARSREPSLKQFYHI